MTQPQEMPIAIALSGGGIRAMAFHLGVLRWMAECRQLERISRISTVSGGSLMLGLLFQQTELRWPTSEVFLDQVYPSLRFKLTQRSMQWGAIRQLRNPWNWRFALSRANLLALTLRKEWGVTVALSELPATPEWSINGTTAQNGKRFRFKHDSLGDYINGYAAPKTFPLANALAVSAAFPGGFGPLVVDATKFEWHKRDWNAPTDSAQLIKPKFSKLHLYDGGVYDNLGLEPFFDAGKGIAKHSGEAIVVSDAGAILPQAFSYSSLDPRRLKRVADIMSDQSHALRVRTFIDYLQKGQSRGLYIPIGSAAGGSSLSDSAHFAANFPTTLRKLSLDEFDKIVEHGFEVTRGIYEQYSISSN